MIGSMKIFFVCKCIKIILFIYLLKFIFNNNILKRSKIIYKKIKQKQIQKLKKKQF
jgi:hypothetical protein